MAIEFCSPAGTLGSRYFTRFFNDDRHPYLTRNHGKEAAAPDRAAPSNLTPSNKYAQAFTYATPPHMRAKQTPGRDLNLEPTSDNDNTNENDKNISGKLQIKMLRNIEHRTRALLIYRPPVLLKSTVLAA